jgi:hypothetical protein
MLHPFNLSCPACESDEVSPLNPEKSSWICENCLAKWLYPDDEAIRAMLKLQELIDAEIPDCQMNVLVELSAASYYLDLLSFGLISEDEAKRKIIFHLTKAQSPIDWINLIKGDSV